MRLLPCGDCALRPVARKLNGRAMHLASERAEQRNRDGGKVPSQSTFACANLRNSLISPFSPQTSWKKHTAPGDPAPPCTSNAQIILAQTRAVRVPPPAIPTIPLRTGVPPTPKKFVAAQTHHSSREHVIFLSEHVIYVSGRTEKHISWIPVVAKPCDSTRQKHENTRLA